MLYIVRVYEDGEQYEYEYGNLHHAEEHIAMEKPTVKSLGSVINPTFIRPYAAFSR